MISMTPFLFVVLLAAVENAIIPTDDLDNRIFGGEAASIMEFPSTAFLRYHLTRTTYKMCGATILSERWVLTAAHCVEGAPVSNVTLQVGKANINYGFRHQASRIIIHEEYIVKKNENGNVIYSANDIAVVEVEEPFPLNHLTIKAARLAHQNEDIRPGSTVTVVGWGLTEDHQASDILRKANLEIISRQMCQSWMGSVPIDRRTLCATDAGGKRTCRGDSGGPVFHNGEVIGVSIMSTTCTRSYYPNVSSSVAYFRKWIKENTGI